MNEVPRAGVPSRRPALAADFLFAAAACARGDARWAGGAAAAGQLRRAVAAGGSP